MSKSLFHKVTHVVRNFIKKETQHCEFCEIFNNTYFKEHLFFLFIILRRYKFLIYKFTNSTMNINSYTN